MEIALRVASGHPMAPVSPPTARIIKSEFSIYQHNFVPQIRTKKGQLMKWYVILLSFLFHIYCWKFQLNDDFKANLKMALKVQVSASFTCHLPNGSHTFLFFTI